MSSRTGHISLPARSADALGSATQSALSLPQSTFSSCEILPHNRPQHNRNVSSGACLCRHGNSPVLDFAPHRQLSREDHEGQKPAHGPRKPKTQKGFSLEADSVALVEPNAADAEGAQKHRYRCASEFVGSSTAWSGPAESPRPGFFDALILSCS